MKRSLNIALLMFLAWATSVGAEALELRIVTTGGNTDVVVDEGATNVPVIVQGKLSSTTTTQGLALWYADIVNTGTLVVDLGDSDEFSVSAPTGMASFDHGSCFCPSVGCYPGPTAYSGADSGTGHTLWQVGGVQNTTNNTVADVAPTGSVVLNIANSGSWVDLASGSIDVDGLFGDTIVLNLARPSATTIDLSQSGPVYTVSPATIDNTASPLTIRVASTLVAAESVADVDSNGGWSGGPLPLSVELGTDTGTSGLSEPRAMGSGLCWVNMTFDDPVDTSGVSVTVSPDPGTTFTLKQGTTANDVELHWTSQPTIVLSGGSKQFAYRFTVGGQGDGEFEIAYITGDVDCSGKNDDADEDEIRSGMNWNRDVSVADPRADVDQSGNVNSGDLLVVRQGTHHGLPDPAASVICISDCAPNPAPAIDCNSNGVLDRCDVVGGTSTDCNDDGVPDACNIADGDSQDCNSNGTPDECETDCNENGVPDDCDLVAGTSGDCNSNSIPDDCDATDGSLIDCDGNGTGDSCQIAQNPSFDCDSNGVLDSCEAALIDTNGQWAAYVYDFSSQYSYLNYKWWHAIKALGEPDVLTSGAYGNMNSWAASDADNASALEYIVLGFETPVRATGAQIYETFNVGFVENVYAVDTDDNEYLVFSGGETYTPSVKNELRTFSPTWTTTTYLVKALIIEMDTTLNFTGEWEETDAVRLLHLEFDCNTNGVIDGCDIIGGTSTDVDTNGIPDEC